MELYGYNPLKNIIFADDFDKGYNGWIVLMPNFRQDKFDYYDSFRGWKEWGPPMLSSATFQFAGTHGSLHGNYSMKVASKPVAYSADKRPAPGSQGVAIKRLTHRFDGLLKCEMYYSYTAEQNIPGIGDEAIRSFGFIWDICNGDSRTHWGARYLNCANGKMKQHWQVFKVDESSDAPWGFEGESAPGEDGEKITTVRGIDSLWLGDRKADGSSTGFYDIPDSKQKLCYNETPDKINWHYFALTIDLKHGEYVSLESVNRKWDLRGIKSSPVDRYPRIDWLLNPFVFIETDTDRRVFLYVDSIVNSCEEC